MMTLQEIKETIKSVQHPHINHIHVLLPNISNEHKEEEGNIIRLRVGYKTIDRESKEPFVINNDCEIDMRKLNKHILLKNIRDLLMTLALHEIDELFEYKGKRLFDPHKDRNLLSIIYHLGKKYETCKMGRAIKVEFALINKEKAS